jgi:hypothetical protein
MRKLIRKANPCFLRNTPKDAGGFVYFAAGYDPLSIVIPKHE